MVIRISIRPPCQLPSQLSEPIASTNHSQLGYRNLQNKNIKKKNIRTNKHAERPQIIHCPCNKDEALLTGPPGIWSLHTSPLSSHCLLPAQTYMCIQTHAHYSFAHAHIDWHTYTHASCTHTPNSVYATHTLEHV